MHTLAIRARALAPGLLLSAAVAGAAVGLEPALALAAQAVAGVSLTVPAMVIALIIGIVLYPLANRAVFRAGITYAVKSLLRMAIGLLGLRIALGDIVALGPWTPVLVVAAMVLTVIVAMRLSVALGQHPGVGALAGAATAVCGASATLATATVLPSYRNKEADVAFTVVAANAVSTLVMVLYPPLSMLISSTPHQAGVLLGATIHDMAQVVGAGYPMSDEIGNAAVIVKLFRVFLLLPMILAIGWWFRRNAGGSGEAKVAVPVFAIVFLVLCLVNSAVPSLPLLLPIYAPIKAVLVEASTWGMLIAIAALGLGTSITAILTIGWRHLATFFAATLTILILVAAGLRFA